MKAALASAYGGPEVLSIQEVARPIVKEGEVLVKVMTSAATRADLMMLTGKPLLGRLFLGLSKPKHPIPGTGFAGIVEEVGHGVKRFKKGDRVFGLTILDFGANAEYLRIGEEGVLLHMPEDLDYSQASNFGDGHLTSYNFLQEIAKVKAGQRVLINGASGALGSSAVQIAKYLGAEVTAVSSAANHGLVKSLGADHVMDYKQEDFTQLNRVYDVVFDTIGNRSYSVVKPVLDREGVYLTPVLKLTNLWDMFRTALTPGKKAVFEATGMNKDPKLKEMLQTLLKIYSEGKLQTVIDRQFPLEKLADAYCYIETGRKKGNVVIYNL